MDRRRGEEDDEERQALRGPSFPALSAEPAGWPTVDGPLGLSAEEGVGYARSFFRWGFFFLPFLWAVNCFYFWPVLRRSPSTLPASSPLHQIRPYVMRSAIGFLVFSILLTTWSLTFMIGGEQLFGPVWKDLVMYNLADKLGLTGWT
ncbi:putative gamma-secretase subunit PEN-2 [Iris pallida]|uniref:Gamma-secretase subunit PEN-2 n=1 Tax=Iris pallida TaxID=29817 RepID=A0AAX6EPK1_IRIPA|nr:putative gamma-secretase subunit PEN-2 [Iris pallida]